MPKKKLNLAVLNWSESVQAPTKAARRSRGDILRDPRFEGYTLVVASGNQTQFSSNIRSALKKGKNVVVSWSDNEMYHSAAEQIIQDPEITKNYEVELREESLQPSSLDLIVLKSDVQGPSRVRNVGLVKGEYPGLEMIDAQGNYDSFRQALEHRLGDSRSIVIYWPPQGKCVDIAEEVASDFGVEIKYDHLDQAGQEIAILTCEQAIRNPSRIAYTHEEQIRGDPRFYHSIIIEPSGSEQEFTQQLTDALAIGQSVVVSWTNDSIYRTFAEQVADDQQVTFGLEVLEPLDLSITNYHGRVPPPLNRSRWYEGCEDPIR